MGRLTSKGGVRGIDKNHRSLTGKVSVSGQESQPFESSLERDFYQLLDFAPDVTSLTAQPIEISYQFGRLDRRYFPDVKAVFSDGSVVFYEVKYRVDLAEQWPEAVHKYRAAIHYCRENGARFKIVTEKEIRGGSMLQNIKFLRRFRNPPIDYGVKKRLIDTLRILGPIATPKVLLEATNDSDEWKSKSLRVLWYLIATHEIQYDWYMKLTMNSPIWLSEKSQCLPPLSYRLRRARSSSTPEKNSKSRTF